MSTIEFVIPHYYSRLKLDFPTFSGYISDWHNFWSAISARLSRETGLSEHEKISCLENAMFDKGALHILLIHLTLCMFEDRIKNAVPAVILVTQIINVHNFDLPQTVDTK